LHIEKNAGPSILFKETTPTNGAAFVMQSLRQYMIISNESGFFRIQDNTASQDRLSISPAGNMGINQPNPTVKLHVTGTSPAFRLEDGTQGLGKVLTSDANGNATWQAAAAGVTGTGTATQVAFWNTPTSLSSSSSLFWDNTNSRLGIGSTSPGHQLEIFTSAASTTPLAAIINGNATGDGVLRFTAGATHYSIGSDASDNAFKISNSAFGVGSLDRFTIISNGNVGIATTTPTSKLNVNGDIGLNDGATVATNNAITILLTNNTGTTSVVGDIVIVGNADNSFGLTNNPGNYAVLGVVTEAVASGSPAKIAISGVVTVNIDNTAAVVRGQHCITGNQNGRASGIAIPNAGNSVGVFLTNGVAGGTAKVLLK
jgi:hypothetical protein